MAKLEPKELILADTDNAYKIIDINMDQKDIISATLLERKSFVVRIKPIDSDIAILIERREVNAEEYTIYLYSIKQRKIIHIFPDISVVDSNNILILDDKNTVILFSEEFYYILDVKNRTIIKHKDEFYSIYTFIHPYFPRVIISASMDHTISYTLKFINLDNQEVIKIETDIKDSISYCFDKEGKQLVMLAGGYMYIVTFSKEDPYKIDIKKDNKVKAMSYEFINHTLLLKMNQVIFVSDSKIFLYIPFTKIIKVSFSFEIRNIIYLSQYEILAFHREFNIYLIPYEMMFTGNVDISQLKKIALNTSIFGIYSYIDDTKYTKHLTAIIQLIQTKGYLSLNLATIVRKFLL